MTNAQILSQATEMTKRLTVRVEADGLGGDLRFVWTGGEAGLKQLDLRPELSAPSGRGDVNPALIPPLGKIHFLGHYAGLVKSCWPKARPGAGAVELQAMVCEHDVVEAARAVTDAYNAVLHLAATVAGLEDKRGHGAKELQDLWSRTTEALRARDRTMLPRFTEWKEELSWVSESEVPAEFKVAFNQAVQLAGSRLESSARTLGNMVGREIIAKVFLRAAQKTPSPAVRPREADVWTWPWTEEGDYSVLLGLLAVKLFENTAGDPTRWDPELWFDRLPLQFGRAPRDQRDFDGGGYLMVKAKWMEDGQQADGPGSVGGDTPRPRVERDRPVSDLLQELVRVWQIYGRKKGSVRLDYLRKILKDGTESGEAERLLLALEQAESTATRSALGGPEVPKGRYLTPDSGSVLLQRFVPLLAAVAVDYELKAGRLFADATVEGGHSPPPDRQG